MLKIKNKNLCLELKKNAQKNAQKMNQKSEFESSFIAQNACSDIANNFSNAVRDYNSKVIQFIIDSEKSTQKLK